MPENNGDTPQPIEVKAISSLEDHIRTVEKSLGIETDYDRQIEAALFIDKKFITYAIITGTVKDPERIFGADAWADYLDGKQFVRQYGDQPLTPQFIHDLHQELTHRIRPDISGKIRTTGVIGASYDGVTPMTYTKDQLAALLQNPQLTFEHVPEEDTEGTTGFIVYPYSELDEGIDTAVSEKLQELCDWYNEQKKQTTHDPHELAALLQHRLISLHPFHDGNGRLTRLLMNWSLENDGQTPCIIDEPTEDILTDEKTWVNYIKKGSKEYTTLKARQNMLTEAGIDDPPALFQLGQDTAFYTYIFRHLVSAPPLPTNGDVHKHETYMAFLTQFHEEMNTFLDYMQLTSQEYIDPTRRHQEITHGGLITSEYTSVVDIRGPLSLELQEDLFTDIEVYRGGLIEEDISNEQLCRLFTQVASVGTGYRALDHANVSPLSVRSVQSSVIQESLDYYNKMFALTYFKEKHGDIPNPYGVEIQDLNTTVRQHVKGDSDIWNSPFTSTSFSIGESRRWATNFYATYAKGARTGILYKAYLPKEGVILTSAKAFKALEAKGFAHEMEALVCAGIPPAAVTGIEVYNKDGSVRATAERKIHHGVLSVMIDNNERDKTVRRIYTYDPAADSFSLVEETSLARTQWEPISTVQPTLSFPDLMAAFAQFEKSKLSYEFQSIKNESTGNDYHSTLLQLEALFEKKSLNMKIFEKLTNNDESLHIIPEQYIHPPKSTKENNPLIQYYGESKPSYLKNQKEEFSNKIPPSFFKSSNDSKSSK